MPRPERAKVAYPEGADQRLLKRLERRALAERKKLFDAEHKAFLQESQKKAQMLALVVDRLGLKKEDAAKALASKRSAMKRLLLREKPPPF